MSRTTAGADRDNHRRGFSLIELLVVAAILATLFLLLLPALKRSRSRQARLEELTADQQATVQTLTDAGFSVYPRLDSVLDINSGEIAMTPELFANVTKLTDISTLSIQRAWIADQDLLQLPGSRQLTRLELCAGQLTDDALEHLRLFPRLETLRLDWNPIQGHGLKAIGELSDLTMLSLAGTPLTGGLDRLSGLTQLRHLYLPNTLIDDAALSGMPDLPRLEQLQLSGTFVTSTGIATLPPLTSLETLWLDETQATDEALKELDRFPNLSSLYLSGTRVKGATFTTMSDLPRLEQLILDDTEIGDESVARLSECTSLRRLSLVRTQVGDDGLNHLATLPELRYLTVSGTNVTAQGVKELLNQRPALNIVWTRQHAGDAN